MIVEVCGIILFKLLCIPVHPFQIVSTYVAFLNIIIVQIQIDVLISANLWIFPQKDHSHISIRIRVSYLSFELHL